MMKNINWFDNVEQRPHPWPGLNWLTTSIYVEDVCKAVSFYTEVMKMVSIFELEDDNGELLFARIRYRGSNFIVNKAEENSTRLSPVNTNQVPSFIFYLYTDDVKKMTTEMRDAGAIILIEPEIQFWGDLKARLKDPFGYWWDIAEKI
ncbi:VOC family protein [Terrimonas sp.]|uniref:VOC family protein n=1 Tax=Terrimonas sp. TaxID=1914338 RepID=UPI001980B969|nr:VOC family protein [Terrimonas sp.]